VSTNFNGVLRSVAAVLLVGAIAGCRGSEPKGESAKPDSGKAEGGMAAMDMSNVTFTAEQIKNSSVKWAKAEAATATESVELPGELLVNEDRTARVSAPERGRVLTVNANIGDRVHRGQVLATIQSDLATGARADRAKAMAERESRQAALDFAKAARERAERLLALKAVAVQDVERARSEEAAATAALAQARADIERVDATLATMGVDPATGQIRLSAAFDGVVLARDVIPGAVVDAGAIVLVVTDPDSLWLNVAVPGIRSGNKLRFTVPSLGDESFDALVRTLAPAVDAASRTVTVRAVVTNRGGKLRPNMLTTVHLDRGQARTGVAVPDSAIQLVSGKSVVFTVMPDEKGGAMFMKREVHIDAKMRDGRQLVTGIDKGDVIVTEGAFAVKARLEQSKLKMGPM